MYDMKILDWFKKPAPKAAAQAPRPAKLPPPLPPVLDDEEDYRRTAYN